MSVTDPIADMLTRIRNAATAGHPSVLVPASRLKISIARILKEEGFIKDYEVLGGSVQKTIKLYLIYGEEKEPAIRGLERKSKPGRRVYMPTKEIPRVYGGVGITILSTSQGVMTGQQARHKGVGGELICYVW